MKRTEVREKIVALLKEQEPNSSGNPVFGHARDMGGDNISGFVIDDFTVNGVSVNAYMFCDAQDNVQGINISVVGVFKQFNHHALPNGRFRWKRLISDIRRLVEIGLIYRTSNSSTSSSNNH